RHTRFSRDWSSDVCSSDLGMACGARFSHGMLGASAQITVPPMNTSRASRNVRRKPYQRMPRGAQDEPMIEAATNSVVFQAYQGRDRKSVVWGKSGCPAG